MYSGTALDLHTFDLTNVFDLTNNILDLTDVFDPKGIGDRAFRLLDTIQTVYCTKCALGCMIPLFNSH